MKIGGAPVECVFFDAVGTLIQPRELVGETYARFGARHGLSARAEHLEAGFRQAFREASPPPPGDDREWWKQIVSTSFVAAGTQGAGHRHFAACFEELFNWYATAEAWSVFSDVIPVLTALRSQGLPLWVVSNFDERLPAILEDLELSEFFEGAIFSSQVGVAKPAPAIFAEAVSRAQFLPTECLHVGDDPRADWEGGKAAGLQVFELRRPLLSLENLLAALESRLA